ncbi:MAG: hypothetical protein KBT32_01000 [Bacteroidales bacterium]|nr:hypothetical protein [Candidatus Physcocola equi]
MIIIPFDIKTQSFRSKVRIYNSYLNYVEIDCLWDTGASRSSIPEYYAQLLMLKAICTSIVDGNNGKTMSSVYMTTFELDSKFVQVHPTSNSLDFALIGMDIISKGKMVITNDNGKLTMYFAFVEEAEV